MRRRKQFLSRAVCMDVDTVSTEATGYLLPAETTLGAVHLTVADPDVTSRFYQGLLGYKPADGGEGRITFSATGEPPAQLVLTGTQEGRRRRTAGLYHFAILLPSRRDLARALRHLIESAVRINGASDHGVSEAIYLQDPEGNGIEIYADRPRERWPMRGGTLAMGTTALDVEDLLAQDARPWEGVPEGTRIGHVHLHVASLGRAERFYAGVLGFEVTVRGYPDALFLSAGGYHHHIGLNTWAGTDIAPRDPLDAGLRYFTVVLPDRAALHAALDRLRAAGAPLEEPGEGERGGWLTRDPDGIGVLLTS